MRKKMHSRPKEEPIPGTGRSAIMEAQELTLEASEG